jgi:hypothetical protein
MAGTSSAHLFETTSVNRESGKFARNALMAGVVRIKSPIRLSWRRRIFTAWQEAVAVPTGGA